ncbi:hypothetical protein [Christensenella tenuis]|jgi:hypothetical protein|uniref:Uncharacterized protein n=1 Tax=Christensenella tenuis TaxID=2763033 RepID=A0ABR7EFH2_9FIRM|nr:hypothetical protein [Christensenella tenuis]MBC5648510.1 hypothetical protein [Christensenella tenuis]
MALNGLIFDRRNNTSKNWRNILAEIMGDGILNGCEVTSISNAITVGDGYFILKGAVIENNGADTIPVTPTLTDGYVRLICRIDLTQEASETGPGQVGWVTDFSATTTFPALTQEDINSTGSIYEGEIAVLQIVGGNITALTRSMPGAEIDAEKLGGHPASYFVPAIKPTMISFSGGGITWEANWAWFDGRQVHINFSGRTTAGTDAISGVFAQLPASIPRPSGDFFIPAFFRKATNDTVHFGRIVVSASGQISTSADSGGGWMAIMAVGCYPAG